MRIRFYFRRVGRWFFALTAASALVVASTVVRAEDVDGDTVDERIEDQAARAVDFRGVPNFDPVKMWVESQSVGAPVLDMFRVSFDAGEFRVEYAQESPFLATSFDLKIVGLVEWNDSNDDGRFQPASEWLSEKTLGDSAFDRSIVTHSVTSSAAAGSMNTMRVQSTDNEVVLELMITERFFRLPEGRILTPMEMKLNFTLSHTLSNPGMGVALHLRMDTGHSAIFEPSSWDAAHGFSRDESWISVSGGPGAMSATVFFSWSNNATVDDATERVDGWGPDGGSTSGSYDVFLAYPAGSDSDPSHVAIRHDPTLGVVSAAFESVLMPPVFRPFAGDPLLYGVSVAAIATIVATTMVLAKRRRRT